MKWILRCNRATDTAAECNNCTLPSNQDVFSQMTHQEPLIIGGVLKVFSKCGKRIFAV